MPEPDEGPAVVGQAAPAQPKGNAIPCDGKHTVVLSPGVEGEKGAELSKIAAGSREVEKEVEKAMSMVHKGCALMKYENPAFACAHVIADVEFKPALNFVAGAASKCGVQVRFRMVSELAELI
jgi:hypothetical protein